MEDIVLEVRELKKHFGKVCAVEDVSLRVPRGQIYGFLGPNGAGKTTTIGMILGLLYPTAGSVRLFGEVVTPGRPHLLRRVGALVGEPALVPYLSARENLALLGRINGYRSEPLKASRLDERIDQLLEQVGITEAANRRAGKYSSGMKQRLGLAMALIHEPELLILDEPTQGMDPAGMREVRLLLLQLADQGSTIFLSSHLLHEVEQICDQVAVINKGRIVAQGYVNELIGGETVVRLRLDQADEAARLLGQLLGARNIETNGTWVTLGGLPSQEVVAFLVERGMLPSEVSIVHSDLESVFLELTANN